MSISMTGFVENLAKRAGDVLLPHFGKDERTVYAPAINEFYLAEKGNLLYHQD